MSATACTWTTRVAPPHLAPPHLAPPHLPPALLVLALASCADEALFVAPPPAAPDAGAPDASPPTPPPAWHEVAHLKDLAQPGTGLLGERVAIGAGHVYASSHGADGRWRLLRASESGGAWTVDRTLEAAAVGSEAIAISALVVAGDAVWLGTAGEPGGGATWRVPLDLSGPAARLSAPPGVHDFGFALAADQARLVVGAPRHDAERGAVFVYALDGAPIGAPVVLGSPMPTPGERFGYALALDGARLLVGAPTACPTNRGACPEPGAAHVFDLDDPIAPPRTIGTDHPYERLLGSSVLWVGSHALLGAPSTYACVATRAECPSTAVTPPDPSDYDCPMGELPCVSVGRTVIGDVGATLHPLRLPPELPGAQWGSALAATARWLVISAVGDASCSPVTPHSIGCPGAGAVHIFERVGEELRPDRYLKPFDASTFRDHFGASTAIEGDVLVVGAPDHNGCEDREQRACRGAGAVYIYRFQTAR